MVNCVKCSNCGTNAIIDRAVFAGMAKYAVFCKKEECKNSKQKVGDKTDYFDTRAEATEKWNNMHSVSSAGT